MIFGALDAPTKGLPLLFGHHQQQNPPNTLPWDLASSEPLSVHTLASLPW